MSNERPSWVPADAKEIDLDAQFSDSSDGPLMRALMADLPSPETWLRESLALLDDLDGSGEQLRANPEKVLGQLAAGVIIAPLMHQRTVIKAAAETTPDEDSEALRRLASDPMFRLVYLDLSADPDSQ